MNWDNVYGIPHKKYRVKKTGDRVVRIFRLPQNSHGKPHDIELQALNDKCSWCTIITMHISGDDAESIEKVSEDTVGNLKRYAEYLYA